MLIRENLAKDREIRRLNRDVQSYEQTIMNMRNEMPHYHPTKSSKKDAEVMVNMGSTQDEDSSYQVRQLRKVNIALSEEFHRQQKVCAALNEQCRAAEQRLAFKDELVREMRRQLKQAKTKMPAAASGQVTSTPNGSGAIGITPDVSVIEPTYSVPILISDDSLEDLESAVYDRMNIPTEQSELPHCLNPAALRQRIKKLTEQSRVASELQNSVISSLQNATNELKASNPEICKSGTELSRFSSQFKANFGLQTLTTVTKRTSPVNVIEPKVPQGSFEPKVIPPGSNSNVICQGASKSCPSTPRATQFWPQRARSQSPPSVKKDSAKSQTLSTTLKDIISKITASFSPAETKADCTECLNNSSTGAKSRDDVTFTRSERAGSSTSRDVQELYFNGDLNNRHAEHTGKEAGSVTFPPWIRIARPYFKQDAQLDSSQRDTEQNTEQVCSAPCKCLRQPPTHTNQPAQVLPCGVCQPSSGGLKQAEGILKSCMPCSSQARPPRAHHTQTFRPQDGVPQRPRPPVFSPRPSYIRPQQLRPCTRPQSSCPRPPLFAQSPPLNIQNSGLCGAGGSTCSAAQRAAEMQQKLCAAQQCLELKEDTIRMQAESLKCAEQRLAALTLAAAKQRADLEDAQRELCKLRSACPSVESGGGGARKVDGCCQCDNEVENQKNMVKTLQSNLSVIEELYRECFYETAKQEELIEKLRKSYLDGRLMEKEKWRSPGRSQSAGHAHNWSLDKCQGIAMEVEDLKMEILNFLNNSNNDSGMWEQSLAGEVGEDINDIMQQLHQLREMLQVDSTDTSALIKENCNLVELNRKLEIKLEAACCEKLQLQKQVDDALGLRKENDNMRCEVRDLKRDMEAAEKRACHLEKEKEEAREQLQQAQAEMGEMRSEMSRLREENELLQCKNEGLAGEIERADLVIKENLKIRSSVSYLTQQVSLWRRQLQESEERVRCVEAELARARSHCRSVDQCYREKVEAVCALESQLQEAHARGAALCAESRRVVAAARGWIRRMQAANKEQSETIKMQESCIAKLECALQQQQQQQQFQQQQQQQQQQQNSRPRTPICSRTPSCQFADCYASYRAQTQPLPDHVIDPTFPSVGCGKCASRRAGDVTPPSDDTSELNTSDKGGRNDISLNYQVGCSKCAPKRRTATAERCVCERDGTSAPSCSHAPAPPRRVLRKKLYNDRVTQFLRCTGGAARSVGAQAPLVADAGTRPAPPAPTPRAVSPATELMERVSRLGDAMEESQRRWSRTKLPQKDH